MNDAIRFQEMLRHVVCMGVTEFCLIFPDMSSMWCTGKFEYLKDDPIGFICNLDSTNAALFHSALIKYCEKVGK